MNDIDLRRMTDREIVAYWLLGSVPRPGWPGRRRAIAIRLVQVAGMLVALVGVMVAVSIAITLVFALADALPAVPR